MTSYFPFLCFWATLYLAPSIPSEIQVVMPMHTQSVIMQNTIFQQSSCWWLCLLEMYLQHFLWAWSVHTSNICEITFLVVLTKMITDFTSIASLFTALVQDWSFWSRFGEKSASATHYWFHLVPLLSHQVWAAF